MGRNDTMTSEHPDDLIARARTVAFQVDQGDVGERLDAAIAAATSPRLRGRLLLARAILRQGSVDLTESADDCRTAFLELRRTDLNGSAALAAAFAAVMLHRSGDLEGGVEMAVEAMASTDGSAIDSDTSRAANALAVFYGEIAAFGPAIRYAAAAFATAMSPEVKEIAACTSSWVTTEALRRGVEVDLAFAADVVCWLETAAVTEFGRRFAAPNARMELALALDDVATISTIGLDESLVDVVPVRMAAIRQALLGSVAYRQGHLETARRHLDLAIPVLAAMGNQHRLACAYRTRSHVRAELGDLQGALEDVRAEADFVGSIQIEHVGRLSEQIAARSVLEAGRKRLIARTAELTAEVHVDPVTKVGSRRWLETVLDDLEGRIGYSTVAMFDLDNFKAVNDRYGHAIGDAVLERVGRILLMCSRPSDLVARYGGEEFTVVFPGADVDGAVEYAERIRRRLGDEDWREFGSSLDVRVSVGVATGSVSSIRSTLHEADLALYSAKSSGRDRVLTA